MSVELTLEVKAATHEIIYDAMLSSIAALNAVIAVYEITVDERAIMAIDSIGTAMRALNMAALRVYAMPVIEDSDE